MTDREMGYRHICHVINVIKDDVPQHLRTIEHSLLRAAATGRSQTRVHLEARDQ